MIVCPYCGAENADGSCFCSLCLGSFAARDLSSADAARRDIPETYPASGQQQPYVSPGDYRALAQEMYSQQQQASERPSAYYDAAMQHPGAVPAIRPPSLTPGMSRSDIAIIMLSYSFAALLVLVMSRLFLGIFLLGAAFGGSEAGLSVGLAMIFISDALILAAAGYAISAKARRRGRGWLFGGACAACVVFFWQPLVSVVLALFLTGEVYIPIFTLVGILFTLFLELPMGALGGWFAEKRLMG